MMQYLFVIYEKCSFQDAGPIYIKKKIINNFPVGVSIIPTSKILIHLRYRGFGNHETYAQAGVYLYSTNQWHIFEERNGVPGLSIPLEEKKNVQKS